MNVGSSRLAEPHHFHARIAKLLAIGVAAVALIGCARIGPIGEIAETIPTDLTFQCKTATDPQRLASVFAGDRAGPAYGGRVALPGALKTDKVAVALVDAVQKASNRTIATTRSAAGTYVYQAEKVRLPDFSPSDFEDFMKAFASSVTLGAAQLEASGAMTRGADDEITTQMVFRQYYRSYLKGEFITRYGVKLAKPEIGMTIGNDAIAGTLIIFLEAVGDISLQTPILKGKNKDNKDVYFPGQSDKLPTALKLKVVPEEALTTDTRLCGVTATEAEAIAWLASLAEDKSAIVSGLILESLAGLELSFVVGGHLAVGDNQTLAVLTKAFVGSTTKHLAEYGAYRFFWHFAYKTQDGTTRSADIGSTGLRLVYHDDDTRSPNPQINRLNRVAGFLESFQ